MTSTNNNASSVSLLLSVLCLGIVFMGGWYFQSSIVELRTLVTNQQEVMIEQKKEITGQKNEILKQTAKIAKQEETVQQLKERLYEQSKKPDEMSQFERSHRQFQSKDQNVGDTVNNTVTNGHNVVKRTATTASPAPELNTRNLEILRGRDGRDGRDGSPGPRGIAGFPGPKGGTGVPGPKGDRAGGVAYVRWGHNSCPSDGAQLVYAGRAGGSRYSHRGGGGNPQCLPLDPNYYSTISGVQDYGYMFGAEYQDTNGLVANSHDTDVPCAVCYVPTRSTLYMMPAKYDCPSGWTREYFGYLMSERHSHYRSQFSCVDHSLTPIIGSHHNYDGFLFYPIEGVCGSLPCPPYTRDKELSCAVCTK